MADVLIRHYVFGIIAFCLIVVGGMSMMGELSSGSTRLTSDPMYNQFSTAFNKTATLTTNVEGIQTAIEAETQDPSVFGALGSLINTAWQSIKFFFSTFGIMTSAYEGAGLIFGIPAWITGLAILAVIVLIGFTIYSAIFQSEL